MNSEFQQNGTLFKWHLFYIDIEYGMDLDAILFWILQQIFHSNVLKLLENINAMW